MRENRGGEKPQPMQKEEENAQGEALLEP